MALNIDREVAVMARMAVKELRQKYAAVFNEEPRSRHKQWLIKRIAWRLQANEEGDLSERARRRAMELANDADLRLMAPRPRKAPAEPQQPTTLECFSDKDRRLPCPGTLITRQYKGRTIVVTVLTDGFEHEGERYTSLSAVARAVTGAHWNGFHFFGLHRPKVGA